jgi:hypothetical protein
MKADAQLIIDKLQEKIKMYEQDALYALFFALNRKYNELAKAFNDFELDLTDSDKAKIFKDFAKDMDSLTKTLITLRSDYLKLSETEVQEGEIKGLPAIETLIKRKGQG